MKNSDVAKVSVIIPFFNAEKTIKRALDSVFSQTLSVSEVIVVDDCSRADSADFLNELIKNNFDGKVKIIRLEKNLGAGEARNMGWSAAVQPYIAFLDADDGWSENKIFVQYALMQANPSVLMTGHQMFQANEEPVEDESEQEIVVREISFDQLKYKNVFSTTSVMLRKEILPRFLLGKRYSEDFLLWMLISLQGRCLLIEKKMAVMYKPSYGHSGLSANLRKMERGELWNFYFLWRSKKIKTLPAISASVFSLSKYSLRLLKTYLRK